MEQGVSLVTLLCKVKNNTGVLRYRVKLPAMTGKAANIREGMSDIINVNIFNLREKWIKLLARKGLNPTR